MDTGSESATNFVSYTLKQGGTNVGTINIPKFLVLKPGSAVVTGTWNGTAFTEDPEQPGSGTGKAIKLVLNDSDDAGKFRTALYYERGFELAFEGQRKWDLIRWGVIKDAMQLFESKLPKSCAGLYVAGTNFVSGKHELFPIPLKEVQSNPKLEGKNNPGYE